MERDHLRASLEEEQLEHAETADDRVKADEQVRHLRSVLMRSNRVDEAWSEPAEVEQRPTSYTDLLTCFSTLEYVVFTGDPDVVRDLSDHDPLFTWGGKIWDVLGALEDYGRATAAGNCPMDVDGYLRNPPAGCRGYPAGRHATDESQDVHHNEKYSAARMLPVPVEFEESGEYFMGAHFKIAQSGLISPRLHYVDATSGPGVVYVGHIGPHLPTKRTN